MYKVLVFAGTTEGYEICRFLADHKIETKGFVATEYGSKSLAESEFLTVQTGREKQGNMRTGQYMWTVFRLQQIIWIRHREVYC